MVDFRFGELMHEPEALRRDLVECSGAVIPIDVNPTMLVASRILQQLTIVVHKYSAKINSKI